MWSGRLCNAKFQVYQHLFDSSSAIDAALRSADYYAAAGELSRYYDAINNVACVYEQLLDTANALHYLGILRDNWDELDESQHSCYYAGILSISSDKKPVLEQYLCDVNDEQVIYWVIVAKSYFEIGNYEQASRALKMAEKYVGTQGLDYKWVNALVQEATGEYRSAAKSYREFIGANGNNNIDIFESDTKFVEERIATNRTINHQLYIILIIVLSLMVSFLFGLLLWVRHSSLKKIHKMSEKAHKAETELLEKENRRLEEERIRAVREKEEYERMYNEAVSRIELLERIKKEPRLGKGVRDVVDKYLSVLNKFIAAHVSKTFDKEAKAELAALMGEQKDFLKSIGLAFSLSHPNFIGYLNKCRLNDWEKGCCCMFCIGLNNSEIADYLKRPSFKNDLTTIRGKLKVERRTNIGIFLQKRMAEKDKFYSSSNE